MSTGWTLLRSKSNRIHLIVIYLSIRDNCKYLSLLIYLINSSKTSEYLGDDSKINCVQSERLGGIVVSILKAETFTEMIKKREKITNDALQVSLYTV